MTGRFAPSPTGDLHLGNLRTALLAWIFACGEGQRLHMRMENLDERSRPEYVPRQLADLAALGMTWDSLLLQSDRIARYEEITAELASAGLLYECYCTRKELREATSAPHILPGSYPGTCRNLTEAERARGRAKLAGTGRGPALRLGGEVGELTITDRYAGTYTGPVDDMVIRRGDGAFAYNFVSVVDDGEYGITQVVRGDDLLSSTPRQVYLQQLLGYTTPEYIHVPLALNHHGDRLAKRDGAVTLATLTDLGWSVEAVRDLIFRSLGMDNMGAETDPVILRSALRLPREPWIVDTAALEHPDLPDTRP